MGEIVAFPACERFVDYPEPRKELTEGERQDILRLRRWFVETLLLNPLHLETRAFNAVHSAESDARSLGQAFCHTLQWHARKRFVIFPERERSASQDEVWFLSLMRAARSGDQASLRSLIAWCIRPSGQRLAYQLVRRIGALNPGKEA